MMTSRGQANSEWDLEDYNTTTYEPQYPDDNASGGVRLDHCRLYVRNIPKALNDEGLRTAFSKYGTLTETYLNKDSGNKYALVRYETPGEAKLAMTKLNNTEPLGLNICIAHKHKHKHRRDDREDRDNSDRNRDYLDRNNGPHNRNHREREDVSSVGSRDRNSRRGAEDIMNGEDFLDDSLPALDDDMDTDIKMKGIQLELQRLQVQEQSMLLKKQLLHLEAAKKKNYASQSNTPSNRCVLPDGRVVVRNVHDRSMESRDADGSFAAGAGDSLTLPALQRDASRACVVCDAPADSFCAQCAVTPYCSARCQRRDWADRHKSVCHNLARLNRKSETVASTSHQTEVPKIAAAAPLRRPHSPAQRVSPRENGPSGAQRKPQQQASYYNNKNRPSNNNRNENRNENRSDSLNENRNDEIRDSDNRSRNQPEDAEKWSTPKPTTPLAKAQSGQPKPHRESPVKQIPKSEPAALKPELTPELIKAVNGLKGPGSLNDDIIASKIVPKTPVEQSTRTVNGLKGPGSLNDVTPASKIVPKTYLLDALSIGDSALLSVDLNAADCRSNKPGFICLSMHERFETDYQNLCEVYVVDCEAIKEDYTPKPGESFSYLSVEDGGWYRARCLTPTLAALLDSGKIVTLKSTDRVKMLLPKYEQCPEFCCLVNAPGIKVGDNLECTIVSKLSDGYKVSLKNVETGAAAGEGEVSRWLPKVEHPKPAPVSAAISSAPSPVPEVPRPDVSNNSMVFLVDATAIDRVFVRPTDVASQKRHDALLQDVVLYGRSASPLKEPPQKGQVVIGQFADGLHYRALCKRTNVKQNKYLLEYIEFGNLDVTPGEKIYPCPPKLSLSTVRTEVSMITLQCNASGELTPPAAQYLDKIKASNAELMLTLPSGAQSAASGSAACLSMAKTGEAVHKRVGDMCTPDWKKMEERGADVVESECLMYQDLEYLDLPASGCELEILDITVLEAGTVSACQKGSPHIKRVLENLTQRMAEYCNSELGKEPYLPKSEELCIARFPPYPQWFRAVLLEQAPGAATAKVCYIDYGNIEEVPVTMLRKMLPEFVRGEAALAVLVDIQDFPKEATQEALGRAVEHMDINDEGRGTLTVTKLIKQECGMYVGVAPGLIEAMTRKVPL